MPSTAESAIHKTSPGIVRRFWWRTNQRVRLTVVCLGVLSALATTGAAGFAGDALPRERGGAGPGAAVHRGDTIEVTVYTVTDVDSFEGMEPATGLFFRARVAGLRRMTGCWDTESRATAQDLLRGKNVRLIVRNDGSSADDGIAVDVRLPDGTDYAQTMVEEGAAAAEVSTRGELAPVESLARQETRGLWAFGCSLGEATATASSEPSSSSSSSSPGPTTTTAAATTTTDSSAQPPSSRPPATTTTTRPPPDDEDDDVWLDVMLGKRCFNEGARRTSPNGNEVVCARNGNGQLRWRRAE